MAFDTDEGFGAGGRFIFVRKPRPEEAPPTDPPYRWQLGASGYASLRGFQQHRIKFDHTEVGRVGVAQHPVRLTLDAAWREWTNDRYYGIGNLTVRERFAEQYDPDDRDDPLRKRYRYMLRQPFLHATARFVLAGPFEIFFAANPKFTTVDTYDGSLLEEEQPFGMAGGFALQGYIGLLYDTRAPEIAPKKGWFVEVSGRFTPEIGFNSEAGGFGGVLASARAFTSAGPAVFAARLHTEMLVGTVPFYEMVQWGGAIPVFGFGGFETIRGIGLGRFRGPGKAVFNYETRIRVATITIGGNSIGLEGAPFFDAGFVWGADGDTVAPVVQSAWPVHPAVGFGGRLVFNESIVGRLDAGYGFDPIQTANGGVEHEPVLGVYFTFDHPF